MVLMCMEGFIKGLKSHDIPESLIFDVTFTCKSRAISSGYTCTFWVHNHDRFEITSNLCYLYGFFSEPNKCHIKPDHLTAHSIL